MFRSKLLAFVLSVFALAVLYNNCTNGMQAIKAVDFTNSSQCQINKVSSKLKTMDVANSKYTIFEGHLRLVVAEKADGLGDIEYYALELPSLALIRLSSPKEILTQIPLNKRIRVGLYNQNEKYYVYTENGIPFYEILEVDSSFKVGVQSRRISQKRIGLFFMHHPGRTTPTLEHIQNRQDTYQAYYDFVNKNNSWTTDVIGIRVTTDLDYSECSADRTACMSHFRDKVREYIDANDLDVNYFHYVYGNSVNFGFDNACGRAVIGGTSAANYCDKMRTILHEAGHNFGVHHGSSDINNRYSEYGDRSTIMGLSGSIPHFTPPHAFLLDITNGNEITVTNSRNIKIAPIEKDLADLASNQYQFVMVRPNNNRTHYLSTRQTSGLSSNSFMVPFSYRNKLHIHRTSGGKSILIKILNPGESYRIPQNEGHIDIDLNSIQNDVADVDIDFVSTTCQRDIQVSKVLQESSNNQKNFLLNVNNNDSNDCSDRSLLWEIKEEIIGLEGNEDITNEVLVNINPREFSLAAGDFLTGTLDLDRSSITSSKRITIKLKQGSNTIFTDTIDLIVNPTSSNDDEIDCSDSSPIKVEFVGSNHISIQGAGFNARACADAVSDGNACLSLPDVDTCTGGYRKLNDSTCGSDWQWIDSKWQNTNWPSFNEAIYVNIKNTASGELLCKKILPDNRITSCP